MVQNGLPQQPGQHFSLPAADDGRLTIVITTPEANDILFSVLSIPKLADITKIPRAWLNEASSRVEDPLPTTQRGDKKGVWYWEFYAWYNRNYGLQGTRRGLDGTR